MGRLLPAEHLRLDSACRSSRDRIRFYKNQAIILPTRGLKNQNYKSGKMSILSLYRKSHEQCRRYDFRSGLKMLGVN